MVKWRCLYYLLNLWKLFAMISCLFLHRSQRCDTVLRIDWRSSALTLTFYKTWYCRFTDVWSTLYLSARVDIICTTCMKGGVTLINLSFGAVISSALWLRKPFTAETLFCAESVINFIYCIWSLILIGPCIANIFVENNQRDATFHNFFISVRRSTCFRRFFRPPSGAQYCTYSVRYLSDHYCYLPLA